MESKELKEKGLVEVVFSKDTTYYKKGDKAVVTTQIAELFKRKGIITAAPAAPAAPAGISTPK